MDNKVYKIEKLAEILAEEKAAGNQIVFTNGCFDLLHIGHTRYLAQAKAKGDILVVGLNSDSSVKKLKGDKRPLIPQDERAEMLSNLEMVDYVTIFADETAKNVIAELEPDIYVKGGDYSINNLPEAEVVQQSGGEIELVSEIKGASTTNIVNKILETYE
ncbi:D-glycero-beta-D-manno-heptose 1-phosphate adenylyltransferase [Halanaerobacter jeridensis]|uniref:D-glycero-beta-D-manno-heptose 1-phosphate adenylyltransferase n=1 Tax=Halanaerobacter jeridensis TaxID=706427 RepID=A0A938XWV6_9FIRM|nr:D-glycero-beta-D-manno-heptose 1-phosphate adenylyltransferase [Halanaerobacter jeridensis]MBM7557741.1 D-beta-D-heptose 7-phosphate kinase/D-beta-D-heptose 1-phosphate adenosyltransferase [Halanaerobacter jeridensis]